jgi:tRNA threonylcarbamoyladenosine biosynthesis protein TsaE
LGRAIAGAIAAGDLVALSGGLGAGKTFLARSLLRSRGVQGGELIGSPTFSLVHEYASREGMLMHADLYRLRDAASRPDDVAGLGLREQRALGAIVIAEWAEESVDALGGDAALVVRLSPGPLPSQRHVELEGPRADEVRRLFERRRRTAE